TVQTEFGITAQEAANPKAISWWPTPAQMLGLKVLSPDAQAFLEYMRDWFYREFSQQDHLTLPGLIRRASNFLRPPDDTKTENTWKNLRSDWMTSGFVLFLAYLSEVVLIGRFDLRDRCAYLWGILQEYSPLAKEVYEARYQARLK